MFVLTVDQISSRKGSDQVTVALQELSELNIKPALDFERTVGDEFQGAFDDAHDTWTALQYLLRQGIWRIGIGIGQIERPLPASSTEARGTAFYHAREAVEAADRKGLGVALEVRGTNAPAAARLASAIRLIGAIYRRRTKPGWEVIDALAQADGQQTRAAQMLGISRQAVSQRLQVALWDEVQDANELIVHLLQNADGV